MYEQDSLEEKIDQLTYEKNKYRAIFESLPNPVILVDEKNQFEYMNQAATMLFNDRSACSARYLYQVVDGMDKLQHNSPAGAVDSCLPWLDDELAAFAGGPELAWSFEKKFSSETDNRIFAVRFSRLQDIAGKFRYSY